MALPWQENDEKTDLRMDFMSDDEIRMVDDLLVHIDERRGSMGATYTRWEAEAEAYAGDQPIEADKPNSRVNIYQANIEGQVSALVDQDIAVVTRGEGPSDQPFARWARIGLDWTLRHNQIKVLLDRHERRRLNHGPAWLKIHWDPDAIDEFGLARIEVPPIQNMFVDGKINDPLKIQDADWIAEVMLKSRTWAKQKYGDMASNIHYGSSDRSAVFRKEHALDDEDAFWLIQCWTKTDGILRKLEFSDDGILLSDSFKEWTGKKFKDIEDPEPFYRRNKYPYWMTVMYPVEGDLHGFGDGKLLRPLQDLLNDLYDQIRVQARPDLILFDPDSEINLSSIAENSLEPIPAKDPNQNVVVKKIGQVNDAMWRLVGAIHEEVQRVTRFSELMLGQMGSADTATEAAIQQQQGSATTDHKKVILQETLRDMARYLLDLMMENYTEGRWFRLDENEEDWEWVDFRQMNEIPVLVPPTSAFTERFRSQNPDEEMPKWMELTDEDGTTMKKSVDLDIEINIGAGLPKNKAFLWRMAQELSQIVVNGKSAVTWEEMRQFIKDFLGMPLEDDQTALQKSMQGQQDVLGQLGAAPPSPEMNPNIEGMGAQQPMMSNLPPGGGL